MSKFKKIAVSVLLALVLACVLTVGVIFGTSFNKNKGGIAGGADNGGGSASATAQAIKPTLNTDYDYEITLSGTPAEMATGWDEAISYVGSRVLVKLASDWTAPAHGTYGTSFGVGMGADSADDYGHNEGTLYVPSTINMTLDLNGHTLDRGLTDSPTTTNGIVIWLNLGTLTIIDSSGNDSGKITGGHDCGGGGGIWNDSGTLNLYGGTITGNKTNPKNTSTKERVGGGGVIVAANTGGPGMFNMYGGKIINNEVIKTNSYKDAVTGGVYVKAGSTFNMYGGEISGNTAEWAGGVGIENSTFNLYGGKITNNITTSTTDGGAGVQSYEDSVMTMNGGEVSGNKAMGPGGGLYFNKTTFTMNGGIVTKNAALGTTTSGATGNTKEGAGGGGIYANGSNTLIINDGEISYNYSAFSGGGIKIVNESSLEMNGGIVTRNGEGTGGWGATGISVGYGNDSSHKCTLALNGGVISENSYPIDGYTTRTDGGGICLAPYSTCTIGGPVVITKNLGYDNKTPHGYIDFWVSKADQITVNGPLYQNGQFANIGIFTEVTSTSANIVKGVTAANLCNYSWNNFFTCQNEGKLFSYVSSQYLRLTNGAVGYFKWSYKTDGDWINLNEGEVHAQLSYGETITAIKAECTDSANTTFTYAWPSGGTAFNKAALTEKTITQTDTGTAINYTETDILSSSGGLTKVGSYTFFIDFGAEPACNASSYTFYASFNIEIVPKDITVVINNDSAIYGDSITLNNSFNNTVGEGGAVVGGWQLADGSAIASGDNYSDLGITLEKSVYGYNVGNYTITGKYSSKNYNVTFVNGVLGITSRPVTIVLHDDWSEYGTKVALTQKPNATPEKAVGEVTEKDGKKYDSKGNLVDNDGDRIYENGKKLYKGGWHYQTDPESKTIVAGDIVNNVYPVVLSSSAVVTSGNTAQGTYDITAKFTNANYTVTFLKPDESAPAAGNEAKATYTVTGAAITVKEPDSANRYNEAEYNNALQNIAIPTAYITLKSGVTTSVQKHKVFTSDDTNKPTETPKADDTTFWSDAASGTATKKEAGEYTVYTLITAEHHEPLVHVWTFTISKAKAAFTLSAKHGTDNVAAAGTVTYNDTAVIVSITFTTSGATTTNCPVKIYYKGTNSGNTYGTAADPTYKDESVDKDGNALNLGNSNAPKEAGTYRATVIADPAASSSYTLDPDSTSSFDFTIEPKAIDLPTSAIATGSDETYDGAAKTFNYTYDTAAVKITGCTGITETVGGETKTYKDLTQGASTPNTATKKTTTAFTATDAGDYAVKFDLTSTRNYKWSGVETGKETSAQIVSCTINKAELDFELVSPVTKEGAQVWQWDAGTTAENGITAKANSLTGLVGSDTVTFNVSWYKLSGSTAGTLHSVQSGIAYTDLDVAISSFTEQASYFLLIQVADGAADNKNDNYCLKQTDNHFTPALEGVKLREITVGAGKVDVSRIIWKWQLENSGVDPAKYVKNAENADDNTKLVYTANKAGNVWTALKYTITADLSDLDYLELDTSKGTDGYENVEYSDAGTYTAKVYIKIKSGSSYEFVTGDTSNGYTADSTTTAYVEFEWTIAKKTISFVDDGGDSLVKWAYSTDAKVSAGGEKDPAATWTEITDTTKPAYTESRIYIKISDAWLESLGLNKDQVTVDYNNTNFQTAAKTDKSTTYAVTLTGDNAKNYAIATGEDSGTYVWQVGYAQIKVTGWGGTREVYDEATDKSFTLPAVDVPEGLEGKIEYTYSYDILDASGAVIGHKDNVSEAEMKADLYPVTDETHPNTTLKVKPVVKSGESFDIVFDTGVPEEKGTTIGEMKTSVTIEIIGSGSEYGGVKFEVKATFYPDNNTNATIKDFIETRGQHLKITITGPEGNTAEMTAKDLTSASEILKNAGIYTVKFEITDADVLAEFALKKSTFTYIIVPKAIAVPKLTGDVVFNGQEIKLADYLDGSYAEYSEKEIVSWSVYETGRDTGKYNATLTIKNVNYVWDYETGEAPAKALARYTVTADGMTVSGDELNANYEWEIKPFVLKGDALWNTSGKTGAALNLPEWVTALMGGENPSLGVEYNYYTDKASPALENAEFKGGNKFFVDAVLNGADAKNFTFEGGTQTSEKIEYTVPQSGAAAFFSNVGSFVKDNWLWFVIGAAILLFVILLIIIIAVSVKKKKKKQAEKEKEEAKAAAAAAAAAPMAAASMAMAQDKAKAEAEIARAKAQAELELERAKAEAEIAKLRAQAQQAQQAQQPVQQPSNNVDANAIAELKAEIAALRASRGAPSASPAPYYGEGSSLAKLEAEIAAMRLEQRALREAELKASQEMAVEKMRTEFAKLRADSRFGGYSQPAISPDLQNALSSGDMPSIPANIVGALILSAMNMAKQPAKPADQPTQVIEAESQPVAVNTPTMYPPDAVITTTTTVDTTTHGRDIDGGDRREGRARSEEDIFDIDGFYDKFDDKN